MKQVVLCVMALVLIVSCSMSQDIKIRLPDGKAISSVEIDRVIQKLIDTAEVTGLCLGIINDNQPVYLKAYGYSNAAKGEKNDTATIFSAASYSKPVFAYLVMRLLDEGRIDLDRPLYQYLDKPLPDYPDYKDLAGDERWMLITARHCLSHTTGFPNWRWANPRGNNKLEIFFKPGERYAYSGEGLQLLQLIVETIMHQGLEELMKEKLFLPLGMIRSSYIWQLTFDDNYALPYDENGNQLKKNKRSKAYAAGSLETTIADYTRFIAAFMQGKGLSQESKMAMLSPQVSIYSRKQFPSLNTDTTDANRHIELSYGLGWGLFKGNYGRSFFKEGHDDGWENYMVCFPDKKFAVVFMTNSNNGESIFREAIHTIIGDASIPWEWEGYTSYKPYIRLLEEYLQPLMGVYEKDGVEAVVGWDRGRLYVESQQNGLSKTTLYAKDSSHFFIKQFDLELVFMKSEDGLVEKIKVNDEGKTYEMKKVK